MIPPLEIAENVWLGLVQPAAPVTGHGPRALLGPTGSWIGIDVVRTSRITRCHARAILTAAEWKALAPHARLRPALAWGLKEAAAKATHTPGRVFPWCLRIRPRRSERDPRGGDRRSTPTLEAGWLERAPFLYAWVVETPNQAKRPSR